MSDFATFWSIAGRWRGRYGNPKRGRGGAEPAWDKALQDGADAEQIIIGARGYVAHIEQDSVEPQMVCMAVTFLNQGRWEQYVELAVETAERDAEELLERRRNYWKYGQRDALQGAKPIKVPDVFAPEVQEAYDQGYRAGREQFARPELTVVV